LRPREQAAAEKASDREHGCRSRQHEADNAARQQGQFKPWRKKRSDQTRRDRDHANVFAAGGRTAPDTHHSGSGPLTPLPVRGEKPSGAHYRHRETGQQGGILLEIMGVDIEWRT
jgi:hypothetical protein